MKIIQIILLFALSFSATCYALKSDRSKLAHIKADYVQHSPKNNQTILRGHVYLDQGTTHIRANKVYIFRNHQGKTQKIILYGIPAYYRTVPDGNNKPMIATANKIIYYPNNHKIALTGKAHINQNNNLITAPHIVYNTQKQTLLSKTQGKRTIITFQPQS